MSVQEEQDVSNEISIQDLELSLQVYQIENDEKLNKLKALFEEKGKLDLRHVFYEERSSLQVKFQNIIGDLTQFLINQEVPSTEKLRKTFERIIESPMLLLFKVSRFQIFNLKLNAFDIELEPIEAICELAKLLDKNIDEYVAMQGQFKPDFTGSTYQSYQQFLQHAKINLISDQIFILYSYLRKGANILKKKVQDRIKIIEAFNSIQEKLIPTLLKNQDVKTIKELSTLNYEIYLLEHSFDVLCFYLKVPFKKIYKDVFKDLQLLATKAKNNCNFDSFIHSYVKFHREILQKIKEQGVDQCYNSYIQNALITLLELWGCRICHYRQFYDLFKKLFQSHSNCKGLLQICLKHTPKLQKQDISLLRANYRQNIQNKQGQLLSLMKKQSLQEINRELNGLYHRVLYNLDFQQEARQKIIELLTLVNGNSNLEEFFLTVEKAFKEWNHSIDFKNPHKFIETEFKLPRLKQNEIIQSLKLITNLCCLEEKGFKKEFQELVSKGTIPKALMSFTKYLIRSEQTQKLREQQDSILAKYILWSFKFLCKTVPSMSTQWQKFLMVSADAISLFKEQQKRNLLVKQIKHVITDNIQAYHLTKCIQLFQRLFINSPKNQQTVSQVVELFMKQTKPTNLLVQKFKFFGMSINEIEKIALTKEQADFIKQYGCVEDGILQNRQTGCFKLSELEVITNPIQFQKAMDNYYFTLDSNSKRFLEYIVGEWVKKENDNVSKDNRKKFYTACLKEIISKYPIGIPIFCNVRVTQYAQTTTSTQQYRFVEYLINELGRHSQTQIQREIYELLTLIINCNQIKYRNGQDYIHEQIIPMIVKRAFYIINSSQTDKTALPIQLYQIVTRAINKLKLNDLKIDTIQKFVCRLHYQIQKAQDQKYISELSECAGEIMGLFFRKKEKDIRKQGLQKLFKQLFWQEARTYNLTAGKSETRKTSSTQKPQINDHLMVSPYTLSQQYNIQEYKIKKGDQKIASNKQQNQGQRIPATQITSSLPKKQINTFIPSLIGSPLTSQKKQINLSGMKYDIAFYLGLQNLNCLENKENLNIKQKYSRKSNQKVPQSSESNTSFVQYYLKEMIYPQVSQQIALKTILGYLNGEIDTLKIWSNPHNLQKLFVPLIVFYDFASSKNCQQFDIKKLENIQPTYVVQILSKIKESKSTVLNNILKIFIQIGYCNLWGENYKSLNLYSGLRKAIETKQSQQESYLSILLKKSLDYENLNQIKASLNDFLSSIFTTRPSDQTSLMYKVGIDKNLLNLIMKSLEIQNLSLVSFLFHSNFHNLRLYTDQLHQGLKALNMASKTRSYNQYIQLSKQIQDEEFLQPMKLFQENFRFFIQIEKQGFNFKQSEERKLAIERLINVLRNYTTQNKDKCCQECDKIIAQYTQQIEKLKLSIANRVKSFYLVTKLRDLSYQNAISVHLISEILHQKQLSSQEILRQIRKVQIFSLLLTLFKELVSFDRDWNDEQLYQNYYCRDRQALRKDVLICTTRRFSHSMSKVYEKCDLELDQVIQRCLDQLKLFLSTETGKKYLQENRSIVYPPLLIKSFVNTGNFLSQQLKNKIKRSFQNNTKDTQECILKYKNNTTFVNDLVNQLRNIDRKAYYTQGFVKLQYEGKMHKLQQFAEILIFHMTKNQTLIEAKSKKAKYLTFNKYKTSESTLQQIQLLGYVVGYCVYHSIPLVSSQGIEKLPLHNPLLAALGYGIAQINDLIEIDFKTWQEMKQILSVEDSKTLNLNFSYLLQNLKTLEKQRVQLVDKGASKKVNNLNRQQFCDAVCCHILYKNLQPQIQRFVLAVLQILPKQYLSCLSLNELYSHFYARQKFQSIINSYMKKIGIATPELVLRKGKKYENLKDYQNIEWVLEILTQHKQLREKCWKQENNLFIMTSIGSKGGLAVEGQLLLIEHFESKEQMKKAFESVFC